MKGLGFPKEEERPKQLLYAIMKEGKILELGGFLGLHFPSFFKFLPLIFLFSSF